MNIINKEQDIHIRSSTAEYLTFIAATGQTDEQIQIRYEDENIWITQKTMADLYAVNVRTINYHIKKIFSDRELLENSVIRKFRITAAGEDKLFMSDYDKFLLKLEEKIK